MTKRKIGTANPPVSTPRVIADKCLDCSGYQKREVSACDCVDCKLHAYRLGRRPRQGSGVPSPMRAIREYCLWCCCGDPAEVRLCPSTECPLYSYRFGMSLQAYETKCGRDLQEKRGKRAA